MLDLLIHAAAVVSGIPVLVVVLLAIVTWAPPPLSAFAIGGLAAVAMRRDATPTADAESVFLRSVAAELRAGATLRSAAITAADAAPELDLGPWARHAAAGRSLVELAPSLGRRLPISGRATAAALGFVAASGGAAADVFARLAAQTDDAISLSRERRIASAQARLSAVVVACAPVPVLVWLAVRGTLGSLVTSGPGLAVLGIGLALELAGVAATVAILRRSRR